MMLLRVGAAAVEVLRRAAVPVSVVPIWHHPGSVVCWYRKGYMM
jgi:hypothetical protein